MFRQPFLKDFRKCWSAAGESPHLADRQLASWRQQYSGLCVRLSRFDDILRRIEKNLGDLNEALTEPIREAGRIHAREGLAARKNPWLALPGTPVPLLRHCEAMTVLLGELESTERKLLSLQPEAFQQLAGLEKKWQRQVASGTSALGQKSQTDEWQQQWAERCSGWRTAFRVALESLKKHVEEVQTTLIVPWEDALQQKGWRIWLKWLLRSQEGVDAPRCGTRNEVVSTAGAAAAVELLRECHLGPGVEVEAALAVLHFEEIRSASPRAARGAAPVPGQVMEPPRPTLEAEPPPLAPPAQTPTPASPRRSRRKKPKERIVPAEDASVPEPLRDLFELDLEDS